MLDLTVFCARGNHRSHIATPWSAGEWTYACDGWLILRVPRRADVPERSDAPLIERFFADVGAREWRPFPKVALPQPKVRRCEDCKGNGVEHECPECSCECWHCNGSGQFHQQIVVRCGSYELNANRWRYLALLPGLRLATAANKNRHVPFEFDGGIGLVMAMRGHDEDAAIVDAPLVGC